MLFIANDLYTQIVSVELIRDYRQPLLQDAITLKYLKVFENLCVQAFLHAF